MNLKPTDTGSTDDTLDEAKILNTLKRELLYEWEHSKTGALPMLKARDELQAWKQEAVARAVFDARLEELDLMNRNWANVDKRWLEYCRDRIAELQQTLEKKPVWEIAEFQTSSDDIDIEIEEES